MFSRVIVGVARHPDRGAAGDLARHRRWARRSGLVTGYFRGMVDDVVSRVIDAVLALPLVIVALLALVALGTSNITVIVVIGLSFAPIIARTVRSAVLAERELDYVAAARLRGENALHIMFVEILPNVLPPILVEATVRLGYAIFTVATLELPRLRHPAAVARLGPAISENYGMIGGGYWWTVLFDALAIASLVVGVNLVADGVQGALDDLTAAHPTPLDALDDRSTSPIASRGRDRAGAARRLSFRIGARRGLRSGRRIRLRQVDRGAGRGALSAAQRPRHAAGASLIDGAGRRWRSTRDALRQLRANDGLDGLPGSRQGAEPVAAHRPAGRRGLRARRRRDAARRWTRALEMLQARADRRSRSASWSAIRTNCPAACSSAS